MAKVNAEKQKEQIVQNMGKIIAKLKDTLDYKTQNIENISYFEDFVFEGSGLGENKLYIVKVQNRELVKESSKEENSKKEKDNGSKLEEYSTYQIFDKKGELIATVGKDGKIQFEQKYLQSLKDNNPKLFETLQLEDLDFKMPENLKENDITMTEADLEDASEAIRKNNGNEQSKDDSEEKDISSETEEERKQKTAEALGIMPEEIKGLSQINTNEKITNDYNMRDLIPETKEYDRVEIACSNGNNKQGDAKFTILGIKKDGTREVLNSIDSVEGVSTNKKVIRVNEDGSEVQEQSVQGLFRINAKNRDDGIAVSLDNLNTIKASFVNNIMDKEHRRATPIKTLNSEGREEPNYQVRENAGDSKEEVNKESEIYRAKQEKGIDPQSLDGIEQSNDRNIEFIKERIISDAIDQGEMNRQELNDFVEKKVGEANLSLTKEEENRVIQDITERIEDESRFPVRRPKEN